MQRNRLIGTGLAGAIAVALCIALAIPGFAVLFEARDFRVDRNLRLSRLAERSTILDSRGTLIGYLGTEDRQFVELDAIPKILQDAVIAVEDETFWTNAGIDVHGIFRAVAANLEAGEIEQGGSTITQQLVKNRILTSKRTVERKIEEMILAMQLDEKYSKRQILEQYLNTVYFGQGAYGVQAAMERFTLVQTAYGPAATPLAEITVGQAALFAGLIASPEANNPFVSPERAARRRSVALRRMVALDVITEEQAAAAEAEPLPSIRPIPDLRPRSSWVEEVQDRLLNDPLYSVLGETTDQRRKTLLTGGLTVTATLDPDMQSIAQEAMDTILPEKPGFTGSLVAIDPRNGAVRAMVAGPGFEESQYNIATSYPGRQAGSTWKVITLAAALTKGHSPQDRVSGSSPCKFGDLGETRNAEGGGGTMTIRQATANSVNCAYARLQLATGFPLVIETAQRMGIQQQTLKPFLTLTLGAIESTPLEMASVAATIANHGVHQPPSFVQQIVANDGTVLFDVNEVEGKRAITAEVAACETELLRGVITGGTGTAARLGNRPVAGKTGTTDEKTDANFVGFTPQLAAFVWHGNALARVPGAGFGGQFPARIFQYFMSRALAGAPVEQFPDPGPVCAREGGTVQLPGQKNPAPSGPTVETVPTTVPAPTATTRPPAPPSTAPSTTMPTSPPTTQPPPP